MKFYKKVIKKLPNNKYAQIRFFENLNFEDLSFEEREELFFENLNLLENFYNNKNILTAYLKLSRYNDKNNWVEFLIYWLNKKNDTKIIKENLINFKKTNDKDVIKIVELIYNNLK